MQDILSALPALLDQHSDNEDVRRPIVFAVWNRIAGESLSDRTVPVELDGTRLKVAVADRNWQRNLEQLAPEMLFKMNFIFGTPQVRFIEFVIDKSAVTDASHSGSDRATLEASALEQINEPLRQAADNIQNDDLRRKFLLAAGSCLAREERLANK
jgi:hypothetical protein